MGQHRRGLRRRHKRHKVRAKVRRWLATCERILQREAEDRGIIAPSQKVRLVWNRSLRRAGLDSPAPAQ